MQICFDADGWAATQFNTPASINPLLHRAQFDNFNARAEPQLCLNSTSDTWNQDEQQCLISVETVAKHDESELCSDVDALFVPQIKMLSLVNSRSTRPPHRQQSLSLPKIEAQQRSFLFTMPILQISDQPISSKDHCCHLGAVSMNHSRRSTFLPHGCRSLARGCSPRAGELRIMCIAPFGCARDTSLKAPSLIYFLL